MSSARVGNYTVQITDVKPFVLLVAVDALGGGLRVIFHCTTDEYQSRAGAEADARRAVPHMRVMHAGLVHMVVGHRTRRVRAALAKFNAMRRVQLEQAREFAVFAAVGRRLPRLPADVLTRIRCFLVPPPL